MTTPIDREWRSRLQNLGFTTRGTGGRKGAYGTREVGPITHAVGVLVDEKHRDGAFNVQLNVDMALPAADPPHDVVLVLADLSRSGVRIQAPWEHDPNLTAWWSGNDLESAWRAFQEFGMPWLDRHGHPDHLITYFEEEYRRLDAIHSQRSTGSLWRRVLTSTGFLTPPVIPGYQQYLLWLSMLYQTKGNRERAIERLDAYREWAESRGLKRELERLSRHRALLAS